MRLWLFAVALTLPAHTVSMSRSTLTIADNLARLEVRMPMSEVEHIAQSNRQLLRHFRIAGEGPVTANCQFDKEELVCRGTFLAPQPLVIECRLAEVVLPHHIHTMTYDGKTLTFTNAVPTVEPGRVHSDVLWWAAGVLALAAGGGIYWRRRFRMA